MNGHLFLLHHVVPGTYGDFSSFFAV
ncbi:unnamed protein product [Cuscuta europaea]|uniref:Uncharacterized protein n=1 Tax=Cuscuta europaea TaxID=41803 RepID=A0A9P1EML7_CUSEU|nr:unnamed protein product [Cuscuta europaea]